MSWLAELFFGTQVLIDAQKSGSLPKDEPFDPMLFHSHPHFPGTFPLWLSAPTRARLQRQYQDGVLASPFPLAVSGDDDAGYTCVLIMIGTANG